MDFNSTKNEGNSWDNQVNLLGEENTMQATDQAAVMNDNLGDSASQSPDMDADAAAAATEITDIEESEEKEVDSLTQTPYIPDTIFANLPTLLKTGSSYFNNNRERDVFLTSALSVLSGCFHTVKGNYGGRTVFSNLYSFVVAPPANGKGALTFARELGNKIHNSLITDYELKKKQYQLDLRSYQAAKNNKKNKGQTVMENEPSEPDLKVLFIPGNVSLSKLIEHLVSNGEKGIFCETEADVLADAFKQDWGGYSTLLRQAFHHESAGNSRIGSGYKMVQHPRLSVTLTGTLNQVGNIIRSAEDGLFSRFMYYCYKQETVWRDMSPDGNVNLTDHFRELSLEVENIADRMNKYSFRFNLTSNQWCKQKQVFSKMLNEINTFVGGEADSVIIRLGLIHYRIAMVLSILRYAEMNNTAAEIICRDEDFESALSLIQVYKEHSLLMFCKLPRQSQIVDKTKLQFYQALPAEIDFKRQEAVETGKKLSIGERSVGNYLSEFVEKKLLVKPVGKYGYYKKAA